MSASICTPYAEPYQYTLGVNNQASTMTYNRDAQTRRITDVNLSTEAAPPQIEDTTYTYDPTGNITRSVDTQGGGSGAPVETDCYTYDANNQLLRTDSAANTTTLYLPSEN